MRKEGKAKISEAEGVFFNPNMELCRDVCSLAIGAIGEQLAICDGFCATGIRGIRYKKENRNVKKIVFVDYSKKACIATRKNLKLNRIRARVVNSDISSFLLANQTSFDLVEIDPFGSPMLFLFDAIRSFRMQDGGYLSVTATDVAVLCGAHCDACIKNYNSRPLHNELCHEIGARILLGKMAELAAQFNFGVIPLFTLSHNHFVKIIVRLEKGAKNALASIESCGYFSICEKCLERRKWKLPEAKKCRCGQVFLNSGQMWLDEIHDNKILEKMFKLNEEREYVRKKEISKLLSLMLGEIGMPIAYYDIHRLCKRYKLQVPKPERVIATLEKQGFVAVRTHFRENSIKTSASLGHIVDAIRV